MFFPWQQWEVYMFFFPWQQWEVYMFFLRNSGRCIYFSLARVEGVYGFPWQQWKVYMVFPW